VEGGNSMGFVLLSPMYTDIHTDANFRMSQSQLSQQASFKVLQIKFPFQPGQRFRLPPRRHLPALQQQALQQQALQQQALQAPQALQSLHHPQVNLRNLTYLQQLSLLQLLAPILPQKRERRQAPPRAMLLGINWEFPVSWVDS
jgi:hypothetical protein